MYFEKVQWRKTCHCQKLNDRKVTDAIKVNDWVVSNVKIGHWPKSCLWPKSCHCQKVNERKIIYAIKANEGCKNGSLSEKLPMSEKLPGPKWLTAENLRIRKLINDWKLSITNWVDHREFDFTKIVLEWLVLMHHVCWKNKFSLSKGQLPKWNRWCKIIHINRLKLAR